MLAATLPGKFQMRDYEGLLAAVKPPLSKIEKPDGVGFLRHSLPRVYAYNAKSLRVPVRTRDGDNLVDDPTTGTKGKWPSAWFELMNLIIHAEEWGAARMTAMAAVHGWKDEQDFRAKHPPSSPNVWYKEIEFWRA